MANLARRPRNDRAQVKAIYEVFAISPLSIIIIMEVAVFKKPRPEKVGRVRLFDFS